MHFRQSLQCLVQRPPLLARRGPMCTRVHRPPCSRTRSSSSHGRLRLDRPLPAPQLAQAWQCRPRRTADSHSPSLQLSNSSSSSRGMRLGCRLGHRAHRRWHRLAPLPRPPLPQSPQPASPDGPPPLPLPAAALRLTARGPWRLSPPTPWRPWTPPRSPHPRCVCPACPPSVGPRAAPRNPLSPCIGPGGPARRSGQRHPVRASGASPPLLLVSLHCYNAYPSFAASRPCAAPGGGRGSRGRLACHRSGWPHPSSDGPKERR